MVWFRVDDGFPDHPKVEDLIASGTAPEAISLWTLAGAWCARQLTDGEIPAAKVARLGIRAHARGASELVRVGLWERTETGFRFHDWAAQQPLREDVTAKRDAANARQRRHRDASVTPSVTRDTGVTSRVTDALVTASVTPLPARAPAGAFPSQSRPVPVPSLKREDPEHTHSDSMPFDVDPEPGHAPSQRPELIAARLYKAGYEAARPGVVWMSHAKHARRLDAIGAWAEAQGRVEGKSTEAVLAELFRNAFLAQWLADRDFSLAAIEEQPGALYRPPPKAATGPPKILNTALIRSCDEAIEAERKKRTPNADTIASLERTVANERAHPSGEPEDPRAAYGRRR
jgi:hypothetical protein